MGRLAVAGRSLRTQLKKRKAEMRLSIRVTVAAVSAFALSNLLKIPLPLWTVLTAVVLTQINFGKSLKATFDYLAGTLFGAVYAGAVAALVPHTTEPALAGVLAMIVAPLALLAAINSSFSAATFTGVLVVLVPAFAHVTPIESAVYRVLEVAVGGLVALAASLLVLPTRAHSFVIKAAASMLDLAAQSLPELFSGFTQDRDAAAVSRIHERIGAAYVRLDAAAAEAKHEQISFLAGGPENRPLLIALLRLRHDMVMIGRAASRPLPEELQLRLGPALARVAETAADHLRQCGKALLSRRRAESALGEAAAAMDRFAQALAAVRNEGLTRGLSVAELESLFALGFAIEQLRQNLQDIDACVRKTAHGG
ncbi:FUSC family protein [Methylocystis heyeri]|uniref:FUSC family protein n=1 Tax=Methylocystis heyeri TaxID=391905 RepID=A0A6B8KB69_9HYPH|nr:FUSC family protein [Methylocystis heyeri]QGM44917.1 FUSC family protein [Methylocystis heyeri]